MSEVKHIAIAGNIGAGKTSLAELLAKQFNWNIQYEDVDDNPYLVDFYADMKRWSFNLQIYFLHSRYKQILEIKKGTKTTIQDRTIFEDAKIFAPNLRDMDVLSIRDYRNYEQLFSTMVSQVSPPDLMIYLRASISKLVSQIAKRGRAYEDSIRIDYLKRLNKYYEKWIEEYQRDYSHCKLLIIDCDELDFVGNPEHFGEIVNKVNAELYGLF